MLFHLYHYLWKQGIRASSVLKHWTVNFSRVSPNIECAQQAECRFLYPVFVFFHNVDVLQAWVDAPAHIPSLSFLMRKQLCIQLFIFAVCVCVCRRNLWLDSIALHLIRARVTEVEVEAKDAVLIHSALCSRQQFYLLLMLLHVNMLRKNILGSAHRCGKLVVVYPPGLRRCQIVSLSKGSLTFPKNSHERHRGAWIHAISQNKKVRQK